MESDRQDIGVDVVIKNEAGHVLLTRRSDDNCWSMPGGWVQQHETPDQAAIREVQEETGLHIALDQLAHVYIRPSDTVHLTYLAHYVSGDLMTSHENSETRFRDISEISNWHRDHRERITAALRAT